MNPELEFKWLDDETCQIIFGGDHIITISYEDHGWGGMEKILQGFESLAEAAHISIKVTGELGI